MGGHGQPPPKKKEAMGSLREKKKLLRSKHEEIGSQGYASVEVQHQKHIVTTLIQWADGLDSVFSAEGSPSRSMTKSQG